MSNEADLRTLAAELNQKDNDPTSDLKLRRGTIMAVSGATSTVRISGIDVTGVVSYSHYVPHVGDVVDVLLDGPAPRIIGTQIRPTTPRRIGWNSSLPGSNETVVIGTSWVDIPHFGIACGAVPSGHVILVDWKVWAGGGTQREIYCNTQVSEGNGSRTIVDENRWTVVSDNSPSPRGQTVFYTAQNYSNMTIWIQCSALSGAVTWFLSSGDASKAQHSHILVTDLGYSPQNQLDWG